MSDKNYLSLILTHLAIGLLIFSFPFSAKIYASLIIIVGIYFIVKNKNKNNEALYAAAYVVGSEVLLRATHGNPIHEYGKYFAILFITIGFLQNGIQKKTNPYWLYLLLLIPGFIISAIAILEFKARINLSFNISGPICLGICSLYTYKRKITKSEIDTILLAIGLPVVSYTAYLFFKCPLNNFIIGSTESNFILSGNYAPNQTATILGLGIFLFTTRLFLIPSSNKIILINSLLVFYLYYRALLTFSRGGTITAIVIILILFFVLLVKHNKNRILQIKIWCFILLFIGGFCLTSFQTDNLLWMRYMDKNINGKDKSEERNSRRNIAMNEIRLFEKKPLLGVGVGEGTEIRKSEIGKQINSHSEITRMLAEHGLLGIIALFILIFTPILLLFKNKWKCMYIICFFAFWFLTINHSAMRLAAPAFLYALCLLNIEKKEEISSI